MDNLFRMPELMFMCDGRSANDEGPCTSRLNRCPAMLAILQAATPTIHLPPLTTVPQL
jgi:hypothetical protein